ncbi:MAG: hypothetical protein OEY94_06585 [Alphaproteobacteria bacterium]|nr:hypothetical protein [Alphaproteobacteria bacterium]
MIEEENLLNADIPEKFKDTETGEIKMNDFIRSYKELERKMSAAPHAPKHHDEYCIECNHGLFASDEQVNKRLHEKGFTQDQAQEVYDLAADKLMPLIEEIAADMIADREVEKLINHFGGAEQWKEVSRQLLAFGQKNLPAEVLDNMAVSYEGVIALHRMMKGDEPSLNTRGAASVEGAKDKDLQAMMRDPRYWREKDPAFVEKVTQGFKDMYGG